MTFLLERAGTLTCDVCHEKVAKLYPLTRHDGKHFVPVRACLPCCGPSSNETFGSVSLPRRVILHEDGDA